jgi:hypothetical protein
VTGVLANCTINTALCTTGSRLPTLFFPKNTPCANSSGNSILHALVQISGCGLFSPQIIDVHCGFVRVDFMLKGQVIDLTPMVINLQTG